MKRAPFAPNFVIAVLLALPVGPVTSASAQEPGASGVSSERSSGRAKKAKRGKRGKRAKKEEAPLAAEAKPSTDKEVAVPSGESVAPSTGDNASASSALGGGEEQVRKEGDTDVKTVEFTGLDIEGQLKTPQLLYFLTRLRAEFDRPRLPHRSFMPELSRTSGEKSLR